MIIRALTLILTCLSAFVAPDAYADMERRRRGDAAVDRGVLMSTAETQKKGVLAFNSYQLFFAGLSYGATNNLQLSFTTLLPVLDDTPFFGVASAKYRVISNDDMVVSIQPSVTMVTEDGEYGGLFGGALLADFMLDDDGKWVLTTGANVQFAFVGGTFDEISDGFLLPLHASIQGQLGKIIKLLVEVTVPTAYAFDGGLEVFDEATLLSYGVRFFGEDIGVDLTFLRPIHPDVNFDEFPMGFPFVAFSARL